MRLLICGRFYDILYKNCNKGDLIMASFSMHLAIAKLYLKDHPEENEEEFLEGILEPDTVPSIEKGRTHYGLHAAWSNPAKYLQENGKKIENSRKRGYFLHLVTDYLFYHI